MFQQECSVKKTSTLIGDTSTLINNLTNDGPVQPICLITVDSTSTKNVIVWEKPVTAGIDRFKIYREITTNNYQHIGSVAYSDLSVFSDNDPGINPNTTMPAKPVVRAF